jgi:WD40 repeat protein
MRLPRLRLRALVVLPLLVLGGIVWRIGGEAEDSLVPVTGRPPVILETGQVLLRTPDASERPMFDASVALSPDGREVAAGRDESLYTEAHEYLSSSTIVSLCDVGAAQERARIVLPADETCSVAYSPDGRTLAVGLTSEVKLYDSVTRLGVCLFNTLSTLGMLFPITEIFPRVIALRGNCHA